MGKDDDTASKRPADETARDRATINLQRAFGDLVAKLTRAYEHAFEEAKADPTNFYVVALTAVANFLEKSDVKNEIAHKFIELASFITKEVYHSYARRKPAAAPMTAKHFGSIGPTRLSVWNAF
jgi:hypothetical protein